MPGNPKHLSNPFSTGGGGVNFEVQVQASFVALMLAEGFAPCLPCRPIRKIKLQGRYAGFDTDDLIVFTGNEDGTEERKILGQVKHSISITAADNVFRDVIQAAWSDFHNEELFRKQKDVIALITGPLSATDISDVRMLLEWSRASESAHEFIAKVETTNFSSASKRTKLQAFRSHLDSAKGEAVTDEELWQFLRHFHLLGYDLDIQSGVMHAVLHSLIGPSLPQGPEAVWARIVEEVQFANQNAGTITRESLPDDLREMFAKRGVRRIPEEFSRVAAPRKVTGWNTSEFASALVVATLLGSWNENSDADMEIAGRLFAGSFKEWQTKVRQVLQLPQSPLRLRNGVWSVENRSQLWDSLGPCVFDDHLDRLLECALSVLKVRAPEFELEPEERYAARIYGKVLPHSSHLRKGLAHSIALVGSRPEVLTHCSAGKPETTAVLAVRQLLDDADWLLWGSLNDLLPLLAEAAPEEFLSAVETALLEQPCPFDKLFAQESNGITGRCYLTGLLWALESLAWNEMLLVRVTVALGSLAARDPGGQWANRPINSLTHIFLPWLPQTTASVDKRRVALETLCIEVPAVAWKLLVSLLPGQLTASSHTHKPTWRRWIPNDWTEGVTNQDYWQQVSAYADMAVQMAMDDRSKLNQLIQDVDHLPRPAFERLLDYLESRVKNEPENERLDIWNALVSVAAKHRRYFDADWALPEEAIARVEQVADQLAPDDPQYLYRRLFCGRDWDLYEESGNGQEQEELLKQRRQKVVEELLAQCGIETVIKFAESVESPWHVGYSLAFVADEAVDASVLPILLNAENENHSGLAAGFVWGRYQQRGWEWVDSTIKTDWVQEDIAMCLGLLPFTKATWDRADRLLDDAGEYWVQVRVNPYQAEGDLNPAIGSLIKYGRPWAAIDCLAKKAHQKEPIDKDLAVQALLAAVASNADPGRHDVYHAVEVIKALQQDPRTTDDDLFKVEWAYVPLLDRHYGAKPKSLESRLASDPAFFCEVIRLIFRSKNEETTDEEITEQQRALATNAWRLLHEWETPPGTEKDGSFSGDAVKQWVAEVKQLASESGHLEVALSQIGNVLIHCPPDPSGLTIHRAVAEVLNADDSEEMRQGFAMAIHNSRGAHFVDPTGKPERDLAAKYRDQAEDMENAGFYRLATTLRRVAESYDREAERIVEKHKAKLEQDN